jgi:small ligand-binding sensory domain FIST
MGNSQEKQMKWASALSTQPSLEAALDEVIALAQDALNARADLAILFISTTVASEFPRLLPLLQGKLAVEHLIGCGGNGVIGPGLGGGTAEIEEEPGLALTLAHLPDVNIQTFHIYEDELPDPDSSPHAWTELLEVDPNHQPHFILFAIRPVLRLMIYCKDWTMLTPVPSKLEDSPVVALLGMGVGCSVRISCIVKVRLG